MYSTGVRHSLTINHTTYLRLKKKGLFGESFSELISRILDELENGNSNQQQETS
jgi:predicted CopG family antitoxin